ncbi:tetratricopeptide repeat protein [Porphyrobacter sp. HT-58-2]|uniref:tetratricopeptide repeat protein n=1 Tax=Porphyrobacter sp. HT-58-2 TaxID=2023229 RepID=UPI00155995B2|nr:tetratricopeptide repeat protein [Porphyrobacter sp. HT-58-2]
MTSRFLATITIGAAVIGLAGAGLASGQINGGFPDPGRKHHQRSNCHGAYDLLAKREAGGARLTDAEEDFAEAYEANAAARQPCPAPPDALLAQATNRDVVTQEAFYQLTQYVQQGDAAAHYELALATLNGRVPDVDASLGIATLAEAARLGDPSANYLVGVLRMQPSGLGPQNPAKALEHLEAAAKTEHVDALFMLGLIHAEGIGTKKDAKKALEYFKQAAERGHVHATFSAADLVNRGAGVKADYGLAYRLGRNLVDQGEVVGAVIAASALLQRKDVKKHQNEILHWMAFAETHGDAKIKGDMARFRPQVVSIFDRMNAPPAYRPTERRVCPQRKVCYVDRTTGARNSCHTYTDYWNDCNTTY